MLEFAYSSQKRFVRVEIHPSLDIVNLDIVKYSI